MYSSLRIFEILTFLLVKSFIELVRTLVRENPEKYILSEKFSEDPLEQDFGKHRRSGECSDNPQLDVLMEDDALGLLNSDLISNFTGNTQGRPDTRPPVTIDNTRLPVKRKI